MCSLSLQDANLQNETMHSLCFCILHSLKRKIACKIQDEHYLVKDMPPPSEAAAKMAAKTSLSGKQGKGADYTIVNCQN